VRGGGAAAARRRLRLIDGVGFRDFRARLIVLNPARRACG
jgi:hypothetical protein